MTGKVWTHEDERKLRELYPHNSQRVTAVILGRSHEAVASRAKILHVRRLRLARPWTDSDDRQLRKLFPHRSSAEVAKLCNRTLGGICGRASILGLHKTEKYLASPSACRLRRGDNVGAAYRYPKGHVPANAGLRRPGYAPGRMAQTQFKKGQVSRNYLPIGTIKPDSDGYLRKKIEDGIGGFGNPKTWELIHRRTWIDANGPVPPGHAVVFKDGNKRNCALENLELITRRELRIRNSIHRMYPDELKKTIFAAGVLKRRIRETENGKKQTDGPAQPSV